jgi:hypothetical protein
MSDFDNDTLLAPDEMSTLKARADLLGIQYHPSIGLDKLRAKVNGAITGEKVADSKEVTEAEAPAETENQMRVRLRKEANALVRVRVMNMNPAKKEWEGEIITAGNSVVGTVKKYVPFGNDEGWHVPQIILTQLQERQCTIFVTSKDARGNSIRKGKLVKEFAIEILDPLTPEELAELAARQAATKAID